MAKIKVYPNPFVDTIQIESDVVLKSVQLIDILGKAIPVKLQSDMTINVTSLSSGIYFMQLKSDSATQVVRLVKK